MTNMPENTVPSSPTDTEPETTPSPLSAMDTPFVLIVEDDLGMAEVFKLALQKDGYRVRTIHHGRAAIEYLDVIVPDVILLDLQLPEVNGFEIVRQLRDRLHNTHSKIVTITANPGAARYLEHEVDLLLTKPISIHHLRTMIRRLLGR